MPYIERVGNLFKTASILVVGKQHGPTFYASELGSLTVLLLHLAALPSARSQISWSHLAREDHARSPEGRGARWSLSPPVDYHLRAQGLAAADHILSADDSDEAARQLQPWTELAPSTDGTHLGWLADHTVMTPLLTTLVMAATARHRRISTLLNSGPSFRIDTKTIPQLVEPDLYQPLASRLDVTDPLGRLFLSLSIARRHGGCRTWATAAEALGLPGELGHRTARACRAAILCSSLEWVSAVESVAQQLDSGVDHRAREIVVRLLARRSRWHRQWSREFHPGGQASTRSYATTWLWLEYAHGVLDQSPGWASPPGHRNRGYYRRYASRLSPQAKHELLAVACGQDRRAALMRSWDQNWPLEEIREKRCE